MTIIAKRFIEEGTDLGPFTAPAGAVDYVVKLSVTHSATNDVEEGSGFILDEPDFRDVVITARHVLRPAGDVSKVVVRFGTGATCRAVAIAYPVGSGEATDCGVVHLLSSVSLAARRPYKAPPNSIFDGVVHGYRAAETTPVFLPVANAGVDNDLILHSAIGGFNAGTSGGPIIWDGHIVGRHLHAALGNRLLISKYINDCAAAAYDLAKEVLP